MTLEGVDFSSGRPSSAALVAAGKRFVVRYLLNDGQGGKGLDATEIADYHAHGIGVVACYEISADGWRGGKARGQVHGAAARAEMLRLGFPSDRPCYFAVDRNVSAADFPTVDAYLEGCAVGMGSVALVGVYGEADLIDHCAAAKTAAHFWQTYAWSGGDVSTHAHLLQYRNSQSIGGAAVDFDRSIAADFGQWPKPVTPPPATHTLHIAAHAKVHVATVTRKGCVSGEVVRVWGPKASTAGCTGPVQRKGCVKGQYTLVKVSRGVFRGRWVHLGPGVTVTAP